MVYILETKLSESDSVFYALKNIFGIGQYQSVKFCKQLGYSSNLKIKDLPEDQILKLYKLIELSGLQITSDLKKHKIYVSKRLTSIKSYRGLRKIRGLPVRGQRTHTNAKTAKKIRN